MKTLHFDNRSSFLNELDGKVYAVCDHEGKFLCDILEDDYLKLTGSGVLVDLTEDMNYPRIEAESDVLFRTDVSAKDYEEFKEKYGVIIEIDEPPRYLEEAIQYVRQHVDMKEVRHSIGQMEQKREPLYVANSHLHYLIHNLLEEFGEDNDLPDGWWMDEKEIDDILFEL